MNGRSPRLWLIISAVFTGLALTALVVWALVRSTQRAGTYDMVSFVTPSIFNPGSYETARIEWLFRFILIIATIIFVLVESLLLFAVLRFRNRPPEAAQRFHGNTRLEVAWTTAPAVILAVLLGFTLQTMRDVKAAPQAQFLRVKVIGHQWWWEFQYPDLGIVTASEMVVPVNTIVEVSVESADVEHGLWVPELFGKVDAVPGYTNRVRFLATATSTNYYGGQCTQYCGTQHTQMRFAVVVRSAEEFQAWVDHMAQAAAAPAGGDAAAGKELFEKNQCVGCHTINGTAASGLTGPNLTHVGSRGFIAGGMLANTPENMRAWVHDAPGVKPGTLMPSFANTFDDQQLNSLVAYLQSLK